MAVEPVPGGSPGAPSGGQGAGSVHPSVRRIAEWIDKRVEKLEREIDRLMELQTLLENYEHLVPRPGEKPVRGVDIVGGFRVGALFKGEDYLRAVFERPQEIPQEVREFLEALNEMLKARDEESRARAREKFSALKKVLEEKVEEIEKEIEEKTPAIEIVEGPDGTVFEVLIDNVEPENEELQEALDLAIRASYLMVKKDEFIEQAAERRREFMKRLMERYGIEPVEDEEEEDNPYN